MAPKGFTRRYGNSDRGARRRGRHATGSTPASMRALRRRPTRRRPRLRSRRASFPVTNMKPPPRPRPNSASTRRPKTRADPGRGHTRCAGQRRACGQCRAAASAAGRRADSECKCRLAKPPNAPIRGTSRPSHWFNAWFQPGDFHGYPYRTSDKRASNGRNGQAALSTGDPPARWRASRWAARRWRSPLISVARLIVESMSAERPLGRDAERPSMKWSLAIVRQDAGDRREPDRQRRACF